MTERPHIMVVEARYYEDLSEELLRGATQALEAGGATFERFQVPGALEIPAAVRFAAENLCREALSTSAGLRIEPFAKADLDGNADDVVTMDELDELRLSRLGQWDFYQLPNGTTAGSFGDFVRVLFRFSFLYRSEGLCLGNEPGTESGGQPAPEL